MDNIIPCLKIFFIPEAVVPAIIIGLITAVIIFFSFKAETNKKMNRRVTMKFKKLLNADIIIHPTVNEGFIVKYGCTELTVTHYKTLIQILNEFLKDPDGCVREYNKD